MSQTSSAETTADVLSRHAQIIAADISEDLAHDLISCFIDDKVNNHMFHLPSTFTDLIYRDEDKTEQYPKIYIYFYLRGNRADAVLCMYKEERIADMPSTYLLQTVTYREFEPEDVEKRVEALKKQTFQLMMHAINTIVNARYCPIRKRFVFHRQLIHKNSTYLSIYENFAKIVDETRKKGIAENEAAVASNKAADAQVDKKKNSDGLIRDEEVASNNEQEETYYRGY